MNLAFRSILPLIMSLALLPAAMAADADPAAVEAARARVSSTPAAYLPVAPAGVQGVAPGQVPAQGQAWQILANDRVLRRSLERWAKAAGWNFVWDADIDIPVKFDSRYAGDFESALNSVMEGLRDTPTPLQVVLHEDGSGNRLARIVRYRGNAIPSK